ncbi:expressed unknown protein (Partial), partial [Seminavis robusta]
TTSNNDTDIPPLVISNADARLDALDDFNLQALRDASGNNDGTRVAFQQPSAPSNIPLSEVYKDTQNVALLQFFQSAWQNWSDLGDAGRDPMASLMAKTADSRSIDNDNDTTDTTTSNIPALIPGNTPLPHDNNQRPTTQSQCHGTNWVLLH